MTAQPTATRVPQFPDWPDRFARFSADYLQAIPEEIDRLGCTRVFLVVSGTLDRETDRIARLEAAIGGEKVVGKKVGVEAHTPYTDVLDIVEQVHKNMADIIVTVGGSSYSDAAKIALIVHSSLPPSNLTLPAMQTLRAPLNTTTGQFTLSPHIRPPTLKLILTPTTLSAAEYHHPAAATHPTTRTKTFFAHPGCAAHCVVLDPALCTTTPHRVWLGSGMRAVDHCVEALCTPRSAGLVAHSSEEGLRLLVPGLLASKTDPADPAARGMCQLGAWKAMACGHYGVALGASHAVGRQLGSVAGVAHGETSCVLLPAVLKYNKRVNGALQARVAEILWDVAGETFVGAGLERGGAGAGADADAGGSGADAGDLVRALVRALGLPGTLAAVGVTAEAQLDRVAELTLTDIWGRTNPREITAKEQVREILDMAA